MVAKGANGGLVHLPVAPLMHGATQWCVMGQSFVGAKIVLMAKFDPHEVWRLVGDEKVNSVMITGDAMGKPLIESLDDEGTEHDLSSLLAVVSSAALFSAPVKDQFFEHLPNLVITDAIGSSEGGNNGMTVVTAGNTAMKSGPTVHLLGETVVFDEDLNPVEPGSGVIGKIARSGDIPLGYYNDPKKTAEVFIQVRGTRYVMPGDYATVEADGSITLLGRGSIVINSGGEKIFPEEVESAVRSHPDVMDAIVCGAPDERWGQTVAAIIQPRVGHDAPSLESLQEHCRESIAGYKLPRRLYVVDAVERSPSGKPDYTWAAAIVNAGARVRSPGRRNSGAGLASPVLNDIFRRQPCRPDRHDGASITTGRPDATGDWTAHRSIAFRRRARHVAVTALRGTLGSALLRVTRRGQRSRRRATGSGRTSTPHHVVDRLPRQPPRIGRRHLGRHLLRRHPGLDIAGPRRPGLRRAARGHRAGLRGDGERHRVCAGRQHRAPSCGRPTSGPRCRRATCPAATSARRSASPAPRSSTSPGARSSPWPTSWSAVRRPTFCRVQHVHGTDDARRGRRPAGTEPADILQRTGLNLNNGNVVFGYGGNDGDCATYSGWVVSVPEGGGTPGLLPGGADRPTTGPSGWAAPHPRSTAAGNIWVTTGNGSSSTPYDCSDSVLELSPSSDSEQYFAPSNWSSDNSGRPRPRVVTAGAALERDRSCRPASRSGAYLLSQAALGGIGGQLGVTPVCPAAVDGDGGDAVLGTVVYVPCQGGVRRCRPARHSASLWQSRRPGPTGPPIEAGGLVWSIGGSNVALRRSTRRTAPSSRTLSVGSEANHFPTPVGRRRPPPGPVHRSGLRLRRLGRPPGAAVATAAGAARTRRTGWSPPTAAIFTFGNAGFYGSAGSIR